MLPTKVIKQRIKLTDRKPSNKFVVFKWVFMVVLRTWVVTPSMLDINKGGSSSPANRVPIAEEEGVTVAPAAVETEVLGQLDLGPVLASLDKDLKPKWTGPPFFRSNEATWGCLWKCWVCCSCWWCKNSDMWPWGSSLETVPTSSSVRISTPVDLLLLLNGGLVLFALLNKGLAFIRSKKSLQRKCEIIVST